ncbi:hypothetical protein GF373_08080, partial [bacterium]|nr:hypothetical protein [bacterium]
MKTQMTQKRNQNPMTNRPAQRIIIIGGVAAGAKTAAKARREDPHSEIHIFTDEEYISYAGCGEPYYISGHIQDREKLLARTPEQFDAIYRVQVHPNHRVLKIDPQAKTVEVSNQHANETWSEPYDKLVLATGAKSIMPPIPGNDLPGVFSLRTIPETDAIRSYIDKGNIYEAVVVGGGFIGLEMVEALAERGMKVTLVEKMPFPAPNYDSIVGVHIKNKLEEKGVRVLCESTLEEVIGSPQYGVRTVKVNGEEIHADLVLISVGVRPNVELAREAGIKLGSTGAIQVNDCLQTNIPDIYAAGDCAEVKQMVNGKPTWMPLGSTANRQGRVLGINLAGGTAVFPGVLGTGIFRVFDMNVARTGLGEEEAVQDGFDVETVIVPAGDLPHYMPDGQPVITKLIADRQSGRLLGAQCWGSGKVDKVIDTLATALTFKARIEDIQQLDLAYAPPFAPPLGNATTASNVMQNKLDRKLESITPLELQKTLQTSNNKVLLDVRPPAGRQKVCTQDCLNIP